MNAYKWLWKISIAMLLFILIISSTAARAEAARPIADPTLEETLQELKTLFETGDHDALKKLLPAADARRAIDIAAELEFEHGEANYFILEANGNRARMLMTGEFNASTYGYATLLSAWFSGLYEAEKTEKGWRLTKKNEGSLGAKLRQHTLDAIIFPGDNLKVSDKIELDNTHAHGVLFWFTAGATIDDLKVNGVSADYRHQGGVLWVRTPASAQTEIAISYEVDVDKNKDWQNSAYWSEDAGHVRAQYAWHPFFGFGDANGFAAYDVTVTSPIGIQVATTLPQESRQDGAARITQAKSEFNVPAIDLVYASDWDVKRFERGGVTLEIFATPDFKPSVEDMSEEFWSTIDLYEAWFGAPLNDYFATVQLRSRNARGWVYRTANTIVAAGSPEIMSRGGVGYSARAWFAHEVAHGWTRGTGVATNFLMEGIAQYAESLSLAAKYGALSETLFFEEQTTYYRVLEFDGKTSLANDKTNDGVSYFKGSWILKMARDRYGDDIFRKGLSAHLQTEDSPQSLETFIASFKRAGAKDFRSWLSPWIHETRIPDLEAQIVNGKLVITQNQPAAFVLDVPVRIETDAGEILNEVYTIRKSSQRFRLPRKFRSAIRLTIDPDRTLLRTRPMGEDKTFEIDAPPEAEVELIASFNAFRPIAAELNNGAYVVSTPVPEGLYSWAWRIDGELHTPDGEESAFQLLEVEPKIRSVATAEN